MRKWFASQLKGVLFSYDELGIEIYVEHVILPGDHMGVVFCPINAPFDPRVKQHSHAVLFLSHSRL